MLERIVPDELIVFFIILIGVLRLFIPTQIWYDAYIGMLVGFGFFYTIGTVGEKLYKQEVLGGGDVKLYAIIGLVLGARDTLLSVFFASLIGLIYGLIISKNKNTSNYLPFVPFITIGVFIVYFFGDSIVDLYINLF